MNHYPRHLGDWLRDTVHLTEIEECIYSRCIDQYYGREGPLPLDIAQCARLVRATTATARRALASVLTEFFTQDAEGWRQKRCDEEIAKYLERSESAKRSISVRWANRDTNVIRTNPERNTSRKPLTNNQRTRTKASRPALPDWMPLDTWEQFCDFRKSLGKGWSANAEKLLVIELGKLREKGNDPQAVIERSIAGCYRGLFPLPVGQVERGGTIAAWWSSDAATCSKGSELGLTARPGEAMVNFRGRIAEAIKDRREVA